MFESKDAGRATRRGLLMGLGAGAVALAASPLHARSLSRAVPAQGNDTGPDDSGRELREWRDRIGMAFSVGAGGGRLRVVGVEADNSAGPRPSPVRREQNFVVIFEGAAAGGPDGDGIYRLSSLSTGTMQLYLGAAAPAGGRRRLVAAFN